MSDTPCIECGYAAKQRQLCWAHAAQLNRGQPLRPVKWRLGGPPLSFAELERFLARRPDPLLQYQSQGARRLLADSTIATATGFARQTIQRWRARGTIQMAQAERAADHLDVHAAQIWSDYLDLILADDDDEVAA